MISLILEPLSDLLKKVFVGYYGYVYLQGDYPWTERSLGLIHTTDKYGEPRLEAFHTEFLQRNHLENKISLERAQASITNAFDQKKSITLEELIACFNFHYAHDGFLDLINYNCRICGLFQPEPPRDEDDVPSWEICDCCGSQAGTDDIDVNMIRIKRKAWLDAGANWLNPMGKPLYWDLKKQLEDVPPEFV